MKMVQIIAAKSRPEKCSAEDWKKIEAQSKKGVVVPFVTALEAIKNSKGAWQIKADAPPKAEMVLPELESMDASDLKRVYITAMASAGKKLGKQVTRADMIKMIRSVEDSIEIVEE